MGYSCTIKASITYDAIQNLDEFTIKNNDYKYFCEIGKENKDGSITGIVYEVFNSDCGTKRLCTKKGSFKINSDGSIARFPGVLKRLWGALHIHTIEAYDRQYSLYNIA